jgi:hypothetical protein
LAGEDGGAAVGRPSPAKRKIRELRERGSDREKKDNEK